MKLSGKMTKATCNVLHVAYNSAGRTVSSTDSDVKCRRVSRRNFFRDALGDHLSFDDVVYFLYDAGIDENCEILIDDKTRKIKALKIARDEKDNIHHYEVTLV